MVAAVLVELERHDRHPGGRKGGALLRHSAPQHQPTDPCTTLARGGHSAPRPRARWRPMPAGAMSACAHGGRRPIGKSREVFGCRARCFRPAAVPNGRQAHVRWSSISFSILLISCRWRHQARTAIPLSSAMEEVTMNRRAMLAIVASIAGSASCLADPVELSAFVALPRPEPTLQVSYGAAP